MVGIDKYNNLKLGAIGFIQVKVPLKTEIIAAEIYDFSQFYFIN